MLTCRLICLFILIFFRLATQVFPQPGKTLVSVTLQLLKVVKLKVGWYIAVCSVTSILNDKDEKSRIAAIYINWLVFRQLIVVG